MAVKPWQQRFLELLQETGNPTLAAQACGIARETAFNWRSKDPEFARLWAEAKEASIDLLEGQARLRAIKRSDTLMVFLLKAERPWKYGDQVRHIHSLERMTNAQLVEYILEGLAADGATLAPGGGDDDPAGGKPQSDPAPPALPEPSR